jgi:hypothetical protein
MKMYNNMSSAKLKVENEGTIFVSNACKLCIQVTCSKYCKREILMVQTAFYLCSSIYKNLQN